MRLKTRGMLQHLMLKMKLRLIRNKLDGEIKVKKHGF